MTDVTAGPPAPGASPGQGAEPPTDQATDQATAATGGPVPAATGVPTPRAVAARLARPGAEPQRPAALPAPGRVFAYVDNSNVWIEGQRLQAVRLGHARTPQHAMANQITAPWRYDFGRLYELACPPGSMVGRSFLVGSKPPPGDSVWNRARNEGFHVLTYDRNAAGKEKQVDASLLTWLLDDSYQHMDAARGDLAVLVAGDGDFLPAVNSLQRRDLTVRVLSWEHACSRALREGADEFLPLDPYFGWLTNA
ncbi:hypothetical protein GCM10010411_75310 [Actinomadura fulvescens]|uniref:NYN domain-containing protein n=1 Tax=Actinomadura fulvescens TaxID=46160 RepID=A0ABP6CSX5_9ACTN